MRGLARHAGGWLLRCLVTVFAVSALSFLMAEMLPGDMAYRVAAARYDSERIDLGVAENVRVELDLGRPAWQRFGIWLGALARLDLGRSVVSGAPVAAEIGPALRRSLVLVALAWPIATVLGAGCGLALGGRRRGLALATAGGALAAGMPSYVLGLALGLVFAIRLGWLPVAGYGTTAHVVLPAATLALLAGLRLILVTARASHAALRHPSIAFARMKALPGHEVMLGHVLPLVAPVVVAYAFVNLAFLLEGATVVETVFAYPGLGRRLVEAVQARDVPLIEGAGLVIALLVTTANSLADILAASLGRWR